jgi:hypothetical protein
VSRTHTHTHTHTHKRDYHRTGPTSRVYLLHKQISHVYTRSCPITREQHVWFARFEFFESTRPGFAPRAQTTLDLGSHRTPRLAIWHACTHNTYACSYKVSRLQHNVFVHLHLLYMHGISRARMRTHHAHPLSAPLASIFHQQTRIAGVYKHAKCESSRMPGSKVDFFLSVCVFGTLSTQHRAQKHGHLCHQRTCRHALEHTCVHTIHAPSCPHSAAQNGLGAESSRELLWAVPKRLDRVGQSCTLRFVSPLPL